MATKKKATTAEPKVVFTKEALLRSATFANRRDALAVVIRDKEELTLDEAQARLDKFMKGKVK